LAVQVLLLGPQGSGKGTQAKRIQAEYELPHVSTGDILRAAIADGTELGRRVKPIVEGGDLVPDELMVELIRERLGQDDAAQGFVLDGFPRTIAQAGALDTMLREIGRPLSVVLELHVPRTVAVERMLNRAVEEGRSDDTPETIERRLELYDRMTVPVIQHYTTTGNLVRVHGERSINEVWGEISDVLERLDDHP
jgi:adenylate kinase